MNDDELDPLVLAALRDVVPASDALREQHIAAALAEISPAEARSRFTRLSAAAAVVVLLVGATTPKAPSKPKTMPRAVVTSGCVVYRRMVLTMRSMKSTERSAHSGSVRGFDTICSA